MYLSEKKTQNIYKVRNIKIQTMLLIVLVLEGMQRCFVCDT